jgi:hypothetical protein
MEVGKRVPLGHRRPAQAEDILRQVAAVIKFSPDVLLLAAGIVPRDIQSLVLSAEDGRLEAICAAFQQFRTAARNGDVG